MEKLDLDLDFEIYIFEEEFKDESITSSIVDHKNDECTCRFCA